jgi:hypothetical protein
MFSNGKINNGRRAQWVRPNEKELGWQVFREYNAHVGRARRSHVTEIPPTQLPVPRIGRVYFSELT